MKLFLSTVLAVGLIGVAGAEDKKDPTAGKWVVESVTRDGKVMDAYKGGVRVHDAGKYTFTLPAESKLPSSSGTYTVDATKTPATFEVVAKGGTYDGKTLPGIVKVEGDTMTVAFVEPGKDRPTKFESAAGSGVVLAVYKKAK
ncbi:TIGR03067 domain-containing protein [Gemmata sp.]|uniref:TIGR03067 domain-containing protein n=1 Tax=Gemmata sp. TaxID=1914242 RepID=UPI003F71F908